MAKKGWIKKVFPGGNTPLGFYSFYDYIIEPDANMVLVIKGGPGVGKSTFMRRSGEELVEKGYDVEFHYCSSDNESLDGLVVPELGVAMIDGTAPHVVDPKYPGVVDEIIHLGDYWDESLLREDKANIIEANKEIGRLFQRAYRYLKEAKIIHDDWEACYIEALNFGKANRVAAGLIEKIFGDIPVSDRVGKERHLFASAITPGGPLNYLNTLVDKIETRYILKGEPGTGKSTVLKRVGNAALERGFYVEFYHCPLDPDTIDTVIIPSLDTALVISTKPHISEPQRDGDYLVDMEECLDADIVNKYWQEIRDSSERFREALNRAVRYISKAKEVHDEMERFYFPAMDFDSIEKLRRKVMEKILGYGDNPSQSASKGVK